MQVVVDLLIRRKVEQILGDVNELDISKGDSVIVEVEQSFEIGRVTSNERMLEKTKKPIYKIIRKVNKEDAVRICENKQKSSEATKVILDKIDEQELHIKLTFVEYSFDRSKLFIYYTSDTRIDFRQFIKEAGHILRTHIQMVQIGVRDEAKMMGGFGHCGRTLCCCSFLKNFDSITIDMAKEQDINLNVTKLSGLCGRLMCCLAYESKFYSEISKKAPKIGSRVSTPDGTGIIVSLNYLIEQATVELETKETKKYKFNQISESLIGKITHQVSKTITELVPQ